MLDINEKKVCAILDKIIAHELAGVSRYTHYSLMVYGLERLSLVGYFKGHATESLDHALKAGELMTGLGGHPTLETESIKESNKHDLQTIIKESIEHETKAAKLYHELLDEVKDKSVYLEDYARGMIGSEEQHVLDMRKIVKK
ncbi:MAG: bacterioferritin [Neisseriales bacterium]|jgi:bacterioferritin|uniref:Bacterioferritin n=1 Tax=Aquella oligotrophica TaxID=2067065 RepID=A0A2I7N335_9NEIS|nr:ferritin-like domain-containing protein [Aquella oligotrophica]AUR50859.1 bacterioferritin [Aquella oligotrophica]TXI92866.1 MAG: bacterioferritin [Neisseriales bacterium]